MDDAVVVATRRGVVVRAGAARLEALRGELARRHAIRFRQFLDRELLERIQRAVDEGTFAPRADAGIAEELCLEANRANDILTFVMNAPQMFELVRSLTGCGEIKHFAGRIYRFDPRVAHHDSWHDDTSGGDKRAAGFSLNLSRQPYRGGTFQIREKTKSDDIVEIENTGAGDAFFFRIAPELQHRVTNVEGEHPKTAYAGWFVEK